MCSPPLPQILEYFQVIRTFMQKKNITHVNAFSAYHMAVFLYMTNSRDSHLIYQDYQIWMGLQSKAL